MRLAAALTVVVGFILGYALLPALRPAPKATSATGPCGSRQAEHVGVDRSAGRPVEESAGALRLPADPRAGRCFDGAALAHNCAARANGFPDPEGAGVIAAVGEGGIRRRPSRHGDGDVVLLHQAPLGGQPDGGCRARAAGGARLALAGPLGPRHGRRQLDRREASDWCGCPGGRVIDLHPAPSTTSRRCRRASSGGISW